MVLNRDEPRSLLMALIIMLKDLELIEPETIFENTFGYNFDRVLYLEYYLYARIMNERNKARTKERSDEAHREPI